MAAYAALVSVMHIIDQIEHHPRPPIFLDKQQVESLIEKITFLQDFLESYSSHVGYSSEADALEMCIADAAHAVEDVIEIHIVNKLDCEDTSSNEFHEALQDAIEDMDLIKKGVMEITKENDQGCQHRLHRYLSISASQGSHSMRQGTTMMRSDDVLTEVMDKLTGHQCDLQIITIVGMGGIGKTTLARNIYTNQLIKEHFDILVWATISQEYDIRDILNEILSQFKKEGGGDSTENELGEMIYKHLSGMRYLIVLDDMWSVQAWDKVKFFFPNNNIGGRIMITTRLSNLCFQLAGSYDFHIKFLDEDKSWNLFLEIVFGKEDCLVELEEIGKKIVKNCKGLPLSIVVIGGLLSKYKGTREYWEYTLENTSSVINLGDDERCLQILYTSYKELPIHLKPCFLYLGIFQEDSEIRVSELIKLWVAEGFLKPIDGKSLEVVAKEYLMELIHRNLIIVHKLDSNGETKFCKIHDLLRDLCLREAQKQKFFCVINLHDLNTSQGINTERRVVIHGSLKHKYCPPQVLDVFHSPSLVRSLIVQHEIHDFEGALSSGKLRLLRVLKVERPDTLPIYWIGVYELYNLRYISTWTIEFSKRLSASLYWNLHTLHAVECTRSEIWMMPLLRHVELNSFFLPDPPNAQIVLGNLQTLSSVSISQCRLEVVERFSNINKLKISCEESDTDSLYCFNNLIHLHKLEHLNCFFDLYLSPVNLFLEEKLRNELQQNITFPSTLKKLTLLGCQLPWEDITKKIGPLPLLQVLKLKVDSFVGPNWMTVEGQFCSLKFLLIDFCDNLVKWTTEDTHFPRLERLRLKRLDKLTEIPLSIGEIPTLQSIELEGCSKSAVVSAKRILEEQEELGNEGIRVKIMGDRAGGWSF